MANFFANFMTVSALPGPLPGKTRGRINAHPPGLGADLAEETPNAKAFYSAGGTSRAQPAGTDRGPAEVVRESTIGKDWFDKVHIIPRLKIDFGNIITTVTATFEIFNAYDREITFTTFVNNAGAGIDIPELPIPPTVVGAFTSILDPDSTRFGQIKLVVTASPDGPPAFDSTLEFTFSPGGTVKLFIKGVRIALFPVPFEAEMTEYLQFSTDVIDVAAGKEQRISNRNRPRQAFQVTFLADGDARRKLQSLLFGWQTHSFGLPLWHEQMTLTAAAIATATTVTVQSTANVDLRIGGLAVVFKNDATFDVLEVDSFTSTTITFASGTVNAYTIGDLVLPIRIARLDDKVDGSRSPFALEKFSGRFTVLDNETGAPTGDTSAFNSFNSKVLLDGCNATFGRDVVEGFEQQLVVIDNQTGVVDFLSDWARHKRTSSVGFNLRTRAEIWNFRLLLYALRGRQVSFYVPTFIGDMTPFANLASGSNQLSINNIGYAKYVQSLSSKNAFRIRFTDGTSLTRTILSAVEVTATREDLTLNTTWPANRLISEVTDIQFFELSRMDSDEIAILHRDIGRANCVMPTRTVFD